MPNTIDQALKLHQLGQVDEALLAYRELLESHPDDPVVLYGFASILLSRGQIAGLTEARKAIFNPKDSTLDRGLAADSLIQLLLQQQYKDHARDFLNDCLSTGLNIPKASHYLKAVTIPEYLDKIAFDHQLGHELERYHPIESSHYVYAIDVVGGCNLRCPTCPVANMAPMPKGLMPLKLYQKILEKIKSESIDSSPDIWLFNWTEPLLHPEIDQFVHATNAMGMTSFISSNLNMGERIENLIRAQPTRLKISLSSLRQSVYSQTHVRGNIKQVIKNLHQLAKWRDHYRSKTQIWVGHHLYKNTLEDQQKIQDLTNQLGFGYAPSPAILAPIEAVMKLIKSPDSDDLNGLRGQFLFDPLAIRESSSKRRSGKKDCELRFNMTTIQFDGNVNLCCATTKPLDQIPIGFLDHSHQEIESIKYNSAFCKQCMNNSLHLTISDR